VRILALMVTRNEADRYLEEALVWLTNQVDGVLVYDDNSTDNTVAIAQSFAFAGVKVWNRGPNVPTFMEHEGNFRTAALRVLEKIFYLTENDWVFVIDADEFYVPVKDETHGTLYNLADLTPSNMLARCIRIHTVWGEHDGHLQYRVDGAWNTLFEPRLWRWREGGEFANAPMACRNEPTYVTQNAMQIYRGDDTMSAILHYGYANEKDRMVRHKRYTALADHGHHPPFIDSIVDHRVETRCWQWTKPADIL
jgi:glycosyltransferase involved in cell wall biosynthesis